MWNGPDVGPFLGQFVPKPGWTTMNEGGGKQLNLWRHFTVIYSLMRSSSLFVFRLQVYYVSDE